MGHFQKLQCLFDTIIEKGENKGKRIDEVHSREEIWNNLLAIQEKYPEIGRAMQKTQVLQETDQREEDYDDHDNWEEDRPTYSRYQGTYAQEEMGFSDEDIDELFDGDPDYAWNLD